VTPNRWDAWEPQEPAADFAERTVAAALRERVARRRTSSRRWIGAVALAATLVAGAAWGFSAWPSRGGAPPSPAEVTAPGEPVRSVDLHLAHEAVAPAAPPPSSAMPPRRKVLAPEPERSGPDAGRKVILPRCDCAPDQVMCTCF
jgi:hypothetical protein